MQTNSSNNTADCFDRNCDVTPDPMQDNATYTLFAPGQSQYASDYMPGWDIRYPASQVAWEPNPDAPACLTADNCGIYDLQEWIDWIQTNLVEGVWCKLNNLGCQILVGDTVLTVGKAIADCIGLSAIKYTLVYEESSKKAVPGNLDSAYDCEELLENAYSCIPIAQNGDIAPQRILGKIGTTKQEPRWFNIANSRLTAQNYLLPATVSTNQYGFATVGTRYIPYGAIDPEFVTSVNEGNGYNAATGTITINKEGFYRITFTAFVKFSYSRKVGVLFSIIGGLYIDTTVGQTIGRSEKRLFQQMFHRDEDTINQTAVKFSYADYFKVGAKIAPRIWFGSRDTDTINLDLNTQVNGGRLSLERIVQHKKVAA